MRYDPASPAQLDRLDQRILGYLQTDARMTNAALADAVGLSASACLRRVQRLEQMGVIEGYVAVLNSHAIGRSTTVFVEVSLSSQREESFNAFEQAVLGCPDVLECHLMSGGSDYLLRVSVANAQDYERIHKQHLSRLPNVARIHSSFALRKVCQRQPVLD